MIEYRKFYMTLGQTSPDGSLRNPSWPGTDDIVWSGPDGSFPENDYASTVMSLQEVAAFYGRQLQHKTLMHIDSYMPQWRLDRWRRYYDLRCKALSSTPLNLVEQAEYDCFPDPTETHAMCDAYVAPVLNWTIGCINEHNRVFFGMFAATTNDDILTLFNSINYPTFPIF